MDDTDVDLNLGPVLLCRRHHSRQVAAADERAVAAAKHFGYSTAVVAFVFTWAVADFWPAAVVGLLAWLAANQFAFVQIFSHTAICAAIREGNARD